MIGDFGYSVTRMCWSAFIAGLLIGGCGVYVGQHIDVKVDFK